MSARLYSLASGVNGRHTMWIENTNPATTRIYDEWLLAHVDDPVEDLPGDKRGVCFDGAVQVRKDVGDQLIDVYETVEEHDNETED